MEKIIVIGCPGSGKSTFSKELHRLTHIPLFHLDMLYWNSDKTTVDKSFFLTELTKIIQTDKWIIDGNYSGTMELRLQNCDTIFFLDYPTDLCLEGIYARMGKVRSDIPWVEHPEDDNTEFIEFIKSYPTNNRPKVLALLEQYSDKNIHIFHNRQDADAFLMGLQ